MNFSTSVTCCALATLVLTCSVTSAQEDGTGQAPRKKKGRLAYVIYTGGGKFFDNPVTVRTGKDTTTLQLSKRKASQPVKIPADGAIEFVKKNPGDTKNPYTAYARTIIPEGTSKALIVLTPRRNPKKGILFSIKVISLTQFKKGDWLFINLTPRNVAVNIGKNKLGIKPGKTGTYDASQIRKPTNMTVGYAYYHPEKKKWRLLSASTCVIRPTRREICVFHWKPKSRNIDYHGITFVEETQ